MGRFTTPPKINVDEVNVKQFKDLRTVEIVKEIDGCKGCMFETIRISVDNGWLVCSKVVRILTGEDCTGIILKKKETWETCTRENTKVDDVVRHEDCDHDDYTHIVVKYVHKSKALFLLEYEGDEGDDLEDMCWYEVMVK